MSSLYVKNGSNWEHQSPPYVKDGATWKIPKEIFVKDGATWKKVFERIPSNLIIMYADYDQNPDGTIWTSANDRNPIGNTSGPGTVGWQDTHSGSVHGFATTSWSALASSQTVKLHGAGSGWGFAASSHTHTLFSNSNWYHAHGSVGTQAPYWFSLIPTYNAPYIKYGAYFMRAGTFSNSEWTLLTSYVGRYLRFRSSGQSITTGGAGSHSHSSHEFDLDWSVHATDGTNNTIRSWLRDLFFYYKHTHRIVSPALNTVANSYLHKEMHFYYFNQSKKMYNNLDIPSGSIAFCTSALAPSGWSYYSALNTRCARLQTNGASASAGSSSHTHSQAVDYMGTAVPSSTAEGDAGDEIYMQSTAAHAITTGYHSLSGPNVGRYIFAYPVIKD